VSAQPPAKKTAGLIENKTEDSYDLHGISLRAPAVVLVLVLVLEIRILSRTKDEDEYDDDSVRTL
jgi:hypothetical protein